MKDSPARQQFRKLSGLTTDQLPKLSSRHRPTEISHLGLRTVLKLSATKR